MWRSRAAWGVRPSVWRAAICEPGSPIETVAVHHKGVSFPTANGVTQPRRLRVDRKFAAIRVNLAMRVVHFIQDYDDARILDDFEGGIVKEISARDSLRQALRGRISVPRRSSFLRANWAVAGRIGVF